MLPWGRCWNGKWGKGRIGDPWECSSTFRGRAFQRRLWERLLRPASTSASDSPFTFNSLTLFLSSLSVSDILHHSVTNSLVYIRFIKLNFIALPFPNTCRVIFFFLSSFVMWFCFSMFIKIYCFHLSNIYKKNKSKVEN